MICIVGLGNPGEKYQYNRHNVGFMFVDFLNQTSGENTEFKQDKYTKSETVEITFNGQPLLLAKPKAFMNKSGQAVIKIMKNYKLKIENLIVVHDDLDIPLGKFKIRKSGPQLHNGLESIGQHLKSKDFLRIRIGVDNRAHGRWIDGETYVLQNFLPNEQDIINTLFSLVLKRLREQKLI